MTQQEINKLTWYDLPNKIKGFFTNVLNILTDLINRVTDLEDNTPQEGGFSIIEINTKSKWIDGKDIYRIVLEGITGATTNIIDVNILNIDNMILMNGGLNDGDVFYPCFYTQEEENGDVVVTSLKYLISDKIIELRHYLILSGFKENIPGLSYKIIIEYTKNNLKMENNLEICFFTKCNIEVYAGKGRVYCKNANEDNYNYFNIDDGGFNVILNPSADENEQVNFSMSASGIRATKYLQPDDDFSYVQKMYVENPQTLINVLTNCNSAQLDEIKTVLGII